MNFLLSLATTYNITTVDPDIGPAEAMMIVAVFLPLIVIFGLAMYAIGAIFLGMLFKKAGVEAWKAWVPVYNVWTLLEIGGQKGYWAVLGFVPILNIVAMVFQYIAMYNIGLRLDKKDWFVLIAIFLPVVWLIWLAVDDSKWSKKAVTA